ncbi:MAG: pseudouridine synthase [Flavobacteriales bacterium]|nr:pseudouridine synthase [Flavobacteriales bacterium]
MATYAVIKPYGMLSQFTSEAGHPGLSELGEFPKDVYPVGRLDRDSEGLLLLTNDNDLKRRILEGHGGRKIWKTYHVQVEGAPTEEHLRAFERPIQLKAKGKVFTTRPAKARLLPADYAPPWERTPPIRYRANIPTTWIEVQIDEGKNRQVRKMTAAIGFPTLRLIRHAIGSLTGPSSTRVSRVQLSLDQIQSIVNP